MKALFFYITHNKTNSEKFCSSEGFCRVVGPQNTLLQAHQASNDNESSPSGEKSLDAQKSDTFTKPYSEEPSSTGGFCRALGPQNTLKWAHLGSKVRHEGSYLFPYLEHKIFQGIQLQRKNSQGSMTAKKNKIGPFRS